MFKITEKSGKVLENQTLQNVLDYQLSHISEVGKFKIEEMNPPKIKKEKEVDLGKLEEEFLRTLNLGQQYQIQNGIKKVHYSKGIGYHLRTVSGMEARKDEYHYSPSLMIKKRETEIDVYMKDFLLTVIPEFDFRMDNKMSKLELSEQDVKDSLKRLLK